MLRINYLLDSGLRRNDKVAINQVPYFLPPPAWKPAGICP